jgi:hypothetical protein
MKVVSGILIVVSFIVGFSSCQKEVDWSLPNNPQSADTILIKSVIYLDTTKASGLDTMYKTQFTYDNAKRLVNSFSAEYYYSPPSPPGMTTFNYDFFYNGNSKHPFKQIITQGSLAPYHSFLTYNNSNFIIKDSSFSIVTPSTVTIQSYATTASGGFVMVFKEKDLASGIVTDRDSITYRRVITAGNILSGVDSSHHPTLGLSTINYAYNYDNKTNPFLSLVSAYPYLGPYFFTGDGYILPVGRNNATSFSETYFDGVNTNQTSGTVNYIYRSDGLPLTGRITGHPDVNKVLFSYYN